MRKKTAGVVAALGIAGIAVSAPAWASAGGGSRPVRQVDAQTRSDISELVGEYANFWEFGYCQQWANLFSQDGVFDVPQFHAHVVGRAALQSTCEAAQSPNGGGDTQEHAQVNTMLVYVDSKHVRGLTNLIFGNLNDPTSGASTFSGYGDYVDMFVRTSQGWRIESRTAGGHKTLGLPQEFLAPRTSG